MRFAWFTLLISTLTVIAADTPSGEEKTAIDYVARAGGNAKLDERLAAEARVLAKFDTVSDTILSGLKKYPHIGGVEALDATPCTKKGFIALKDLPNLQKLVLGKANLSPEGIAAIGQCKELRHLVLVGSNLNDTQLESLKKLTLLDHLSLSENPKITDKGMQTVKGFDRLKVLYLGKTSITDEGLMELKGLDGLRLLAVGGTKITQEAAEKFADEMPNLRAVRR